MQQTTKSNLLEFCIFLHRICVIKAHYQCALECVLVILVQQCRLGVANVQIADTSYNAHCNCYGDVMQPACYSSCLRQHSLFSTTTACIDLMCVPQSGALSASEQLCNIL